MLILHNWNCVPKNASVTAINKGNINSSYLVRSADAIWVLQKVNPIFKPIVHEDIEAVTQHLALNGITTPLLVKTPKMDLCVLDEDSACWRLLSYIPGINRDAFGSADEAQSAGLLVAQFHRALIDFQYTYKFSRPHVHHTQMHMDALKLALDRHPEHPDYGRVVPVAERIFQQWRLLGPIGPLPIRNSHGDLKINNLIFDERGHGRAIIDLDTLGLMPWPLEMGDALRSWCNNSDENIAQAQFREDLFDGALRGYGSIMKGLWTTDEISQLPNGVALIPLELAARFLADVLNESYFGWDSSKFPSRSEHNWVRANGQLSLHVDVLGKRTHLGKIAEKYL